MGPVVNLLPKHEGMCYSGHNNTTLKDYHKNLGLCIYPEFCSGLEDCHATKSSYPLEFPVTSHLISEHMNQSHGELPQGL